MKLLNIAAGAALAVTTLASSASAWEKIHYAHPWDKGCDKVNCYYPYTSYMTGNYSKIKCKDKTKFFAHKNGKYQCVSHYKVAK